MLKKKKKKVIENNEFLYMYYKKMHYALKIWEHNCAKHEI